MNAKWHQNCSVVCSYMFVLPLCMRTSAFSQQYNIFTHSGQFLDGNQKDALFKIRKLLICYQNHARIRGIAMTNFALLLELHIAYIGCPINSVPTKPVTYEKWLKMKRDTGQKSSLFKRKKTAFWLGISLHFRLFVLCYSFIMEEVNLMILAQYTSDKMYKKQGDVSQCVAFSSCLILV